MSKRCAKPDFYGQKKKLQRSMPLTQEASSSSTESQRIDLTDGFDVPTDTEAAIIYFKNKFPIEKFDEKLPAVILVHQLYSIIKSKTKVDLDVNLLQSTGQVRLFRLGGEESAHVIIYTNEFVQHVIKCSPETPVIKRFLSVLVPKINDVGVGKDVLVNKFNLTEHHISDLLNAGLLVLRSESSFWFSFPNAGKFMKTYLRGRKAILRTIQKSKYGEILQSELQQRKLEKSAKLGMFFHIHDVIGAELVKCVETTSGYLLRLEKKKK